MCACVCIPAHLGEAVADGSATLYRSWTAAAGNPLCDRLHPNMLETVLYALHSDTETQMR